MGEVGNLRAMAVALREKPAHVLRGAGYLDRAADMLDQAAADSDVVGKLVEALREAETVMALVEKPSIRDPDYHDAIAALGDKIGYGALMSGASAAWRSRAIVAGSEFVAGPCQATVTRTLEIVRAALSLAGGATTNSKAGSRGGQ